MRFPHMWKGSQMLSNPQRSMSLTGLRWLLMMSSPQNLRASGGHLDTQALGSLVNRVILGFQGYLWHVLVILHGHIGLRSPRCPEQIPYRLGRHVFQDNVSIPHPIFLRDSNGCLPTPGVTSQREQSYYLCLAFFNVSNREAKSAQRAV